ncbi:hypothetical protein SNE40_009715 [Patella caerulea]|uniref:Uncharacterized protein n=1 Tax=Patella caerulea TaxID=87958 RepID=A0AAN8JZ67_PATCE
MSDQREMDVEVEIEKGSIKSLLNKICKRLDNIEVHMEKIDDIQLSLHNICTKVANLENIIQQIQVKSQELESTTQRINNMSEEAHQQITLNKEQIKGIQVQVNSCIEISPSVIADITTLIKDHGVIKDTLLDLQCRSTKNNLVFSGLNESNPEDTEAKLRGFLNHELGIHHCVEFGNVHRFGKIMNGKHRPIVACFIYYNDLREIKKRGYKLKGTSYGISEQFPAAIQERRKQLYPIGRRFRLSGHRTRLIRDKLFIDSQLYAGETSSLEMLDETPRCNLSATAATQSSETSRFYQPPKRARYGSTPERLRQEIA